MFSFSTKIVFAVTAFSLLVPHIQAQYYTSRFQNGVLLGYILNHKALHGGFGGGSIGGGGGDTQAAGSSQCPTSWKLGMHSEGYGWKLMSNCGEQGAHAHQGGEMMPSPSDIIENILRKEYRLDVLNAKNNAMAIKSAAASDKLIRQASKDSLLTRMKKAFLVKTGLIHLPHIGPIVMQPAPEPVMALPVHPHPHPESHHGAAAGGK